MSLLTEIETYGLADCKANHETLEQARKHHSTMLRAYIETIPPIVWNQIMQAYKENWNQALNGTMASQYAASLDFEKVTNAAIECVTDNDILKLDRMGGNHA